MEDRSEGSRRARVLIGGAGVAALEAALALLDLAGDRVAIELRAPRREFLYRPFAVGVPNGAARILHLDLERLAERCGISFQLGGVVAVEAAERRALTRDGERIGYDYLVLAPGVRTLWAVPGAATFWGVAEEGGAGSVVRKLRTGGLRSVVFTMPDGCSWALPLYELALLASSVLARSGVEGARLTVVTPEQAPLRIFGRSVAEQVERLLGERGIALVAGAHPVAFEDGRLRIAPGGAIEADAVISLPRLEGRRINGVPHDSDGFVSVDGHGRVLGMDRVFAAGDVTAFPVKRGGIAAQQADAVAEAIAAELGAGVAPAPFAPALRAWPEWEDEIVGRYLSRLFAETPGNGSRTLVAGPAPVP